MLAQAAASRQSKLVARTLRDICTLRKVGRNEKRLLTLPVFLFVVFTLVSVGFLILLCFETESLWLS